MWLYRMHRYLARWSCLGLALLVLALTCVPAPASAATVVIYVNASARGANNGRSWADAYTNLQSALAPAQPTPGETTEVWVARGTYRPSPCAPACTTEDRGATFHLQNGLQIYGGFAGTETSLDERDWRTNVTILSGDLLGNDAEPASPDADNSIHVVTSVGTNSTAVLDGVTVSGGRAFNRSQPPDDRGAGILNSGSPRITNVTIRGNKSALFGGGLVIVGGAPLLNNDTISQNFVSDWGGGVANLAGSPTLENTTISGNTAVFGGGGIYNEGSIALFNPVLSGNITAYYGGGGLYNSIHGNVWLYNATIAGNSSSGKGGSGVFNAGNTVGIRNSIIWANGAYGPIDIANSLVEGGGGGSNILVSDPLFVAPVPAAPSAGGNLRLRAGSPAIDFGSNGINLDSDRDGKARIFDYPGVDHGATRTIDLGAYESSTGGLALATSSVEAIEGGAPARYQIRLTAQPGQDVTITITPDNQSTASPPSLTFTPTTWSTGQYVTISAVDDNLAQGPHTSTVELSSQSDDPGFVGLGTTLPIHIVDNDHATYVPLFVR